MSSNNIYIYIVVSIEDYGVTSLHDISNHPLRGEHTENCLVFSSRSTDVVDLDRELLDGSTELVDDRAKASR